eukprot:CAMPEP_0170822136 /NCGR_PEP_ID=MMETSP0733-20121128/43553_1 /TAXON_ID=186038 /ORGANISM="Fragilariopsis kerguelensis, Strain L26-C5" /LENGTH=394 /DNA_ID=CAMNT_0011184185 /DNA_START=1 /DNA_END=1186 /DNA_ORIENTATION=-
MAAKYQIEFVVVDASSKSASVATTIRNNLAMAGQIEFVVVDASNSNSKSASVAATIRNNLAMAGGGYVTVIPQTWKGKKGAALREGITKARELLSEYNAINNDDDTDHECKHNNNNNTIEPIIGFQELEKVDMIQHWDSIARNFVSTTTSIDPPAGSASSIITTSTTTAAVADIVVPRRNDTLFQEFYPQEQYHTEQFANLFLNSLAKEMRIGFPTSLDWTHGPVAFKASLAPHWLDYKGELWDAQLVPIINAFFSQDHGAQILSYEVLYRHPKSMKQQEEGSLLFNEKRLYQLNFLSKTVVFNEKRLYQLNFLSKTVGQKMRELALENATTTPPTFITDMVEDMTTDEVVAKDGYKGFLIVLPYRNNTRYFIYCRLRFLPTNRKTDYTTVSSQ